MTNLSTSSCLYYWYICFDSSFLVFSSKMTTSRTTTQVEVYPCSSGNWLELISLLMGQKLQALKFYSHVWKWLLFQNDASWPQWGWPSLQTIRWYLMCPVPIGHKGQTISWYLSCPIPIGYNFVVLRDKFNEFSHFRKK